MGLHKVFTIFMSSSFLVATSSAKFVNSGAEPGHSVRCRKIALQSRQAYLEAFKHVRDLRTHGATYQISTVIGNPKITFLNRERPKAGEFDSSSGVCKIIVPNYGYGTTFFVGGKLNLLLTNMHVLVPEGLVPEYLNVRLKCGSHGRPATFDFDQAIQIKVEAQGRYNLTGNEEFGYEDVALLSVVNAEKVFANYKHYSFLVTETADSIESVHMRTKKARPSGVLRSTSFGSAPIPIDLKDGTHLVFDPDELFRGDECDVFKITGGGYWSHDCPNLPGSSGSPIFIDRGVRPPILVGMDTHDILDRHDLSKHAIYEPDHNDEGIRNLLIPLITIQQIIKGVEWKKDGWIAHNMALWKKIEDAEEDDDTNDVPSPTVYPAGAPPSRQNIRNNFQPKRVGF